MNILVSNDDGIFALGMRTLATTLAAAGAKLPWVKLVRLTAIAGIPSITPSMAADTVPE